MLLDNFFWKPQDMCFLYMCFLYGITVQFKNTFEAEKKIFPLRQIKGINNFDN